MKKVSLLIILVAFVSSGQAHAEMKLESVRFYIKKVLEPCTDCSWEVTKEGNGTNASGNLGFTKRFIGQGEIVINESDLNTYSTKKTIIPAYVKVTAYGPAARFKVRLTENTVKLRNTAGKEIKDIFSTYYGTRAGVTLLLAGLGIDGGINTSGIILGGIDGLIQTGFGIEAKYVKAELVPGQFTPGVQELVQAEVQSVIDRQQLNETKSLNEILKEQIGK